MYPPLPEGEGRGEGVAFLPLPQGEGGVRVLYRMLELS